MFACVLPGMLPIKLADLIEEISQTYVSNEAIACVAQCSAAQRSAAQPNPILLLRLLHY